MGGTRKPVPRRHCPQCTLPDSTGTPPPELVGKTCTATLGLAGVVCDRQATTVDKFDRPICNAEVWTNVSAHEAGRHSRIPLAPVAQELPHTDATDATDDGRFGTVATIGEIRGMLREELDNFSTEVLRIPATMGQKQAALHPVGLCDDGGCQSCKAQRSGEHDQARKNLADEIESAIEHKGRGPVAEMIRRDGADALAEVIDEWRDAGRPEPSSEADQQIQVVNDG